MPDSSGEAGKRNLGLGRVLFLSTSAKLAWQTKIGHTMPLLRVAEEVGDSVGGGRA